MFLHVKAELLDTSAAIVNGQSDKFRNHADYAWNGGGMDGWMSGLMDEWMGGWVDGWTWAWVGLEVSSSCRPSSCEKWSLWMSAWVFYGEALDFKTRCSRHWKHIGNEWRKSNEPIRPQHSLLPVPPVAEILSRWNGGTNSFPPQPSSNPLIHPSTHPFIQQGCDQFPLRSRRAPPSCPATMGIQGMSQGCSEG